MDIAENIERAMSKIWFHISLASLKNMHISREHEQLSYNSILYLDLIYFMDGKATVSLLAEVLGVSLPGITLKINGLADQGYIIKTPSETDRRVNYLRVNEEKIHEYSLYRKQVRKIAEGAGKRFTPQEAAAFCALLEFMIEKYREV